MKSMLFVLGLVFSICGVISDSDIENQVVDLVRPSQIDDDSLDVDSTYFKDSGVFLDSRDGQEYKWIKVGNQIWMTENLRFKDSVGCYAYKKRWKKASREGYLYTWETAQNVAPEGWHIPSEAEYLALFHEFGTTNSSRVTFEQIVENENFNFVDKTGFYNSRKGGYLRSPRFWTSSYGLSAKKDTLYNFFGINFRGESSWVSFTGYKMDAYSLRCIKD
jgi:uncharacterized protein (TIGR02145 family)